MPGFKQLAISTSEHDDDEMMQNDVMCVGYRFFGVPEATRNNFQRGDSIWMGDSIWHGGAKYCPGDDSIWRGTVFGTTSGTKYCPPPQ